MNAEDPSCCNAGEAATEKQSKYNVPTPPIGARFFFCVHGGVFQDTSAQGEQQGRDI